MARHVDRSRRPAVDGAQRIRAALPVAGICLLLIGAIALGAWWWNIRSVTDPIDADPVDAYAVVVASPPCTSGNETTVRLSGLQRSVTATLSGCGFAPDQRLAVQYLAGHPQQVRLAGTTTAGDSGLSGKLLPIGILAAGLVAVLATIALLVERRRSRHLAAADRITVADLRSRNRSGSPGASSAVTGADGAGRAPGGAGDPGPAGHGPGGRRVGESGAARGSGADRESDAAEESAGDREPDGSTGPDRPHPPGDGGDAGDTEDTEDAAPGERGPEDGDPIVPPLSEIDPGEPSHVLPSGYVIIDEQLFTHSGSEATGPDRPRD